MLTRRDLLKTATAAGAAPRALPANGKRPNFLFILCDQLNLDALSAYGNRFVSTPNLDRLAARGVSFMESHSTNPVCSPARSSLFTSRMTLETGVTTNGRAIPSHIPNMGQWFRQHGYETVYCGKWHLPINWATNEPQGFTVLPVGAGEGSLVDPFIARACETYLRTRTGSDPFVFVASLMNPHDICFWCIHDRELVPRDLPLEALEKNLPELPPNHRSRPAAPKQLDSKKFTRFTDRQWRYYLYAYYRQVEMLDAEIGRILDALEASRLHEDTVVIFTSDHGEGAARHSHVQKWYPYDEAMKVPLIVSNPARIKGGRRDPTHLASGVDVFSTMCDYAGIPAPPHARGSSLRPLLEGKPTTWREFIFAEVQVVGRVIRTPQYKYVRYQDDPVEQLFDMKADTWETKNLYQEARYASVIREHRKLLEDWESRLLRA